MMQILRNGIGALIELLNHSMIDHGKLKLWDQLMEESTEMGNMPAL